jgi:hypothetical protein
MVIEGVSFLVGLVKCNAHKAGDDVVSNKLLDTRTSEIVHIFALIGLDFFSNGVRFKRALTVKVLR